MLKTTLSLTKKFLRPSGISSQIHLKPILPTYQPSPSHQTMPSLLQSPVHYGFEKIFPITTLRFGFATKNSTKKEVEEAPVAKTGKKTMPRGKVVHLLLIV
jgi:hypothetical protein